MYFLILILFFFLDHIHSTVTVSRPTYLLQHLWFSGSSPLILSHPHCCAIQALNFAQYIPLANSPDAPLPVRTAGEVAYQTIDCWVYYLNYVHVYGCHLV